jgi:hypothetical protein
MPTGGVVEAWLQLFDGIKGLNRGDQLDKVMKFADKIQDVSQRKVFYHAFGLPEDFANKTNAELQKIIDQIKKYQRAWSDADTKIGETAWQSFANLKLAAGGLAEEIGQKLAPAFGEIATNLADFIAANREGLGDKLTADIKQIGEALAAVPWRDIAHSIEVTSSAIASLTTNLSKWNAMPSPGTALRHYLWPEGAQPPVPAGPGPETPGQRFEKGGALFDREKWRGGGLFGEPGAPSFRGNAGDKDEPGGTAPAAKPLWRRLFDLTDKGTGVMPAAFRTADGGPNPLLGSPSTSEAGRLLSQAVEKGVFDGLTDYAKQMQPGAGGGGGGGGGMAALRANYSPGGGGGFSGGGGFGGPGGGTGEPSTSGGAASSPMGSLPDLGGALPKGIESLRRSFHPPSIPSGMGGTVADHLKAAGVNLPAHIEEKIRKGGQLSASDLGSLPPATLEKANRAVTGAGYPPLFSDQKPQKFGLGDIRKSLEGTAAGGLPDTGSYGGEGRRGFGGAMNLPSGPSAANSYVAAQRAGFAKELQDPKFRSQFAAMLQAEGPTLGTAESAMNRAAASGRSLHDMVAGPVGRKFYSTYGRFMSGSASAVRKYNPLIDKALGGSDTIRGFTDQGMPTDPNGPLHRGGGGPYLGPYVGQHGNIFNDWQRGRYAKWREDFEAHAHAAIAGSNAAKNMPNIGAAIGGTGTQEETQWQRTHDALSRFPYAGHREGAAALGRGTNLFGGNIWDDLKRQERDMETSEKYRGERGFKRRGEQDEQKANYDLLGEGRRGGFIGQPMKHQVSGNASVDINLNGFPKGTQTKTKMAGMFRELKINRGRAAVLASQEG